MLRTSSIRILHAAAAAVAACVVATIVPVPAAAGSAITSVAGHARLDPRDLPSFGDGAGLEALLERMTPLLRRQPDEVERLEWAERDFVPDWSGDGRPDDLSIHYVFEFRGAAVRTTTTLRVAEGDTGQLLWSRRWEDDRATYVSAVPARVGRVGRPGVILDEVRGFEFGTTAIEHEVRALTGAGKKVWSRRFSSTIVGDWPINYVASDYLVSLAPFDGLPGRATDVLVATGEVVVPPAWRLQSGVVEGAVIDGRDGGLVTHPVPEVGVTFVPRVYAIHDVDDDGLDDYVFVNKRHHVTPAPDGETVPIAVGNGV
ncbi:MAG: hypothetical protein M3273_04360, partial [Actinomycetota bacterium]|nr:hypothetical protein [Actinomycetota bacterium]